jgi:glucosamine kinase
MKQLIADSGGTKTKWIYFKDEDTDFQILETKGLHPNVLTTEEIAKELALVKNWCGEINLLTFYGAGLSTEESKVTFRNLLSNTFTKSTLTLEHDILGAARALCQNDKGIACILGTGSNSCVYNGEEITDNRISLGYLLGDEGSGAYLGKSLLKLFLESELNENLHTKFLNYFELSPQEWVQKLYDAENNPKQVFAAVVPFLKKYEQDEQVQALLEMGFTAFLKRFVAVYNTNKNTPLNFNGSIAFHFQEALKAVCSKNGYVVGRIVKSPEELLWQFHKK